MKRTIVAALGGIIAAFVTVAVIESIGHVIYPPPADVDLADPVALKMLMENAPMGALVFVVLAWAIGALTGGYIAALLARGQSNVPIFAVAVAMLAATAWTLSIIPHPVWMSAAGLLLPIPCAWIGSRFKLNPH